jgi:hypothetical protein
MKLNSFIYRKNLKIIRLKLSFYLKILYNYFII